MTSDQMTGIFAVITEAYPRFQAGKDEEEYDRAIDFWTGMFAGDDPMLVAAAVKAFIATDTKGFPPSIGQIKSLMRDIASPQELTEVEAWALVSKACANSAYDSQAEFEKLPPVLKRLVGSPNCLREWGMLPAETVETVIASNFMRSYRVVAVQERLYQALPEDVKAMAASLGESLKMPELHGEITQDQRQGIVNALLGADE